MAERVRAGAEALAADEVVCLHCDPASSLVLREYEWPAADGDASPDVATNSLIVVVNDIANVVKLPTITPNPFTPYGDGFNDEISFAFDLFLLLEEVDVDLGIYDLSGRHVAKLQSGGSTAGKLEVQWNGRDDQGQLVPPGLYLYR